MYHAIVTPITQLRPHPNADRLQLATAAGSQVVVGLETVEGTLGLYFPTDGQLSHDFCVANHLYTKSAREQLDLPPSDRVGFFDQKRRVRTQRFRGQASDGFWLPLSCLDYLGAGGEPALQAGAQISQVCEEVFCQKYYTPATLRKLRAAEQSSSAKRREILAFPKHPDTPQLRFVIDQIPADALITVTEKLHGTSGRYGLVPTTVERTGWRAWLATWLGLPTTTREWTVVNGSKNVVLNGREEAGSYYGTDQFRLSLTEGLSVRKGEVLYFEIVGDVPETGAAIMPTHSTKDLPEIAKAYGPTMAYRYGCPPKVCRLYVYKILQLNEDGQGVELSWSELVKRCQELGVQHVPILARLFRPAQRHVEALSEMADRLADGPSLLDPTHIREGVVLRVESTRGVEHTKHKSFAFKVMEGIMKLDDTVVDMEEVS